MYPASADLASSGDPTSPFYGPGSIGSIDPGPPSGRLRRSPAVSAPRRPQVGSGRSPAPLQRGRGPCGSMVGRARGEPLSHRRPVRLTIVPQSAAGYPVLRRLDSDLPMRAEPSTMTPQVKLSVIERNGQKCVSTGSPWEPVVGYSRAVRAGDFIFVTGTVGQEPDGRFGTTARDQARRALQVIVAAIEALGGKPADVVRTRMYVTGINQRRESDEVHREYFESVRPATTMVEVSRLIDPQALVEIEADAVIQHEPEGRFA